MMGNGQWTMGTGGWGEKRKEPPEFGSVLRKGEAVFARMAAAAATPM